MNKIASPQDLQSELRKIIALALELSPSREVLASEMRTLASRLVTSDTKFTESDVRQLASKYDLNFRSLVSFLNELLEADAPYWIGKRVAEYEKRKNRDI